MFEMSHHILAKDDTQVYRFNEGPYEDTYFSYGTVRFNEENGYLKISFDYKLYGCAKIKENTLRNDTEFNDVLGQCLRRVLEAYTIATSAGGTLHDDSDNYFEEPNQQ